MVALLDTLHPCFVSIDKLIWPPRPFASSFVFGPVQPLAFLVAVNSHVAAATFFLLLCFVAEATSAACVVYPGKVMPVDELGLLVLNLMNELRCSHVTLGLVTEWYTSRVNVQVFPIGEQAAPKHFQLIG